MERAFSAQLRREGKQKSGGGSQSGGAGASKKGGAGGLCFGWEADVELASAGT